MNAQNRVYDCIFIKYCIFHMNNCSPTFAPLCILTFQRFLYSNNKECSIREILHTQISQFLENSGEEARLGIFYAHKKNQKC